jgi:hypothetical protein
MTTGWLAAPSVKAITIWPLLFAVVWKVSSRAVSLPTRAIEVQVGEHRRTVDGNIECTIAGSREIGLGKMQQHGVDGNQSPQLLLGDCIARGEH